MTHNIVHKNCPSYLTAFVSLASDTSALSTRAHKFKLRTPRVGVDDTENSFVVKSSRLLNDLPEKLCLNSKVILLKIALKTLFFEGYLQATLYLFHSSIFCSILNYFE
jgi:hypothetical protein